MKRFVLLAVGFAAAALVGTTPDTGVAGWRSADRWQPEDDEVVIEEPCQREVIQEPHPRLRRDYRDEPVREAPAFTGTQPYWGTMRPYWNGNEPPGVIHRQLRTAPLKMR